MCLLNDHYSSLILEKRAQILWNLFNWNTRLQKVLKAFDQSWYENIVKTVTFKREYRRLKRNMSCLHQCSINYWRKHTSLVARNNLNQKTFRNPEYTEVYCLFTNEERWTLTKIPLNPINHHSLREFSHLFYKDLYKLMSISLSVSLIWDIFLEKLLLLSLFSFPCYITDHFI